MITALEGGEWSAARPGRTLPPGKTRYPFYRRLCGPQTRSGRAENLVPTWIRSQTIQPVVSRYTDWATRPTHIHILYIIYIYIHYVEVNIIYIYYVEVNIIYIYIYYVEVNIIYIYIYILCRGKLIRSFCYAALNFVYFTSAKFGYSSAI